MEAGGLLDFERNDSEKHNDAFGPARAVACGLELNDLTEEDVKAVGLKLLLLD
jgi:hypothetical protein